MSNAFGARGFRRSVGALFSTALLLAATALHAEGLALKRVVLSSGGLGYFHIDLAEVRTAQGRLHLIVAITPVAFPAADATLPEVSRAEARYDGKATEKLVGPFAFYCRVTDVTRYPIPEILS